MIKPDKINFGKRLDNARRNMQLSLSELGEKVDIKKPTLYSYIQGKALPKKIKIIKIADTLNVTPEYLLWGDNHVDKQQNPFPLIRELSANEYSDMEVSSIKLQRSLLDKVAIGNRINEARESIGLSHSEIAAMLNISKGTFGSYTRGLAFPPEQKLHKISVITGKSYEWLLWGNYETTKLCIKCKQPTLKDICLNCRISKYSEILSVYRIIEHMDFPIDNNDKEKILALLELNMNK